MMLCHRTSDRKLTDYWNIGTCTISAKIQDQEKGPTYRILLWLPIVQNFSKVFLVHGSRLAITVGVVFLLSFLLVECPRLAAMRESNEHDRKKAVYLVNRWAGVERVSV